MTLSDSECRPPIGAVFQSHLCQRLARPCAHWLVPFIPDDEHVNHAAMLLPTLLTFETQKICKLRFLSITAALTIEVRNIEAMAKSWLVRTGLYIARAVIPTIS